MWSHLQLLAGKPLALAGLHWWQRSKEPATQSPCQLMHTGAGQLPPLPSLPSLLPRQLPNLLLCLPDTRTVNSVWCRAEGRALSQDMLEGGGQGFLLSRPQFPH